MHARQKWQIFLDCSQSAFSLKIRLVFIPCSAIAKQDLRPRFIAASGFAARVLVSRAVTSQKKNKRLLAVYEFFETLISATKFPSPGYPLLASLADFFFSPRRFSFLLFPPVPLQFLRENSTVNTCYTQAI